MIHLLLLNGIASASSSASIEGEFFGGVAAGASTAIGVGAGSSAEIDTPGRALAAGKCCKRAAKHKRKKLQLKMKWETCKKAAEAPAEVSGPAAGGGQCTQAELDAAVARAVTAALQTAATEKAAALQTAEDEKAAALAAKDVEIAANYVSNDVVEANYLLKCVLSVMTGSVSVYGFPCFDPACSDPDPAGHGECVFRPV